MKPKTYSKRNRTTVREMMRWAMAKTPTPVKELTLLVLATAAMYFLMVCAMGLFE